MDVYKIVITIIALAIVTLFSVIAEMLGKAQETRRDSPTGRGKTRHDDGNDPQQDEAMTSHVTRLRVDGQQNRESPPSEIHKHKGASLEQDG